MRIDPSLESLSKSAGDRFRSQIDAGVQVDRRHVLLCRRRLQRQRTIVGRIGKYNARLSVEDGGYGNTTD